MIWKTHLGGQILGQFQIRSKLFSAKDYVGQKIFFFSQKWFFRPKSISKRPPQKLRLTNFSTRSQNLWVISASQIKSGFQVVVLFWVQFFIELKRTLGIFRKCSLGSMKKIFATGWPHFNGGKCYFYTFTRWRNLLFFFA